MKIQMDFRRMTASLGCAALLLPSSSLRADDGQTSSPQIGYEVVGQVLNPSAQASQQYGYLNFVRGLAPHYQLSRAAGLGVYSAADIL